MFGYELIDEIDQTLDRLIENASLVKEVSIEKLSAVEKDAFFKMQESLISHFLHVDKKLEEKRNNLKIQDKRSCRYKIQEKLSKFRRLDKELKINSTKIFSKKKLTI